MGDFICVKKIINEGKANEFYGKAKLQLTNDNMAWPNEI
jgi:hypothetical protein